MKKKERIQLSDHFSYWRLIRFTLPTIGMMIVVSIYSIVDGVFVSNAVGKTPFAALNLAYPVIYAFLTIGFMLGSGGSALVAKTLGEGKRQKANEIFSMVTVIGFVLCAVLSVLGFILMPKLSVLLGASGELLRNCIIYGRICFCGLPFWVLQTMFLSFFVTAEKPRLSLMVNIIAGVTNAILDALFIMVFHWELAGAAAATALAQVVGAMVPLIYFIRENDSLLRLFRPIRFDKSALVKTMTNGASEMISNLSVSLVSVVYNFEVMRLAGENGIAAFGVIDYVVFIFMSIFFGYATGASPIVGFHYGARHVDELKNLFRKSMVLMISSGFCLFIFSELLAVPLAAIFVHSDAELMTMTVHGFRLYVIGFIVMGINVWGSAFFTALNDGKTSALLSFARALLFRIISVVVMAEMMGLDGVWLSFTAGEMISLVMTLAFFGIKRKQYQYF